MNKTNQEKIAEISARIDTVIECCCTTPHNFAKVLAYTRAQTVYDILNKKCAPSYDFFNRFTDSEYSVIINLRWLLNGEGEMWTDFMRKLSHEDQITVVDNVNHGISVSSFQMAQAENSPTQKQVAALQAENAKLKERASQASMFYRTVLEQAEEIGRLREQVAQLTQRLQKNADAADTSATAHVG